MQRYAFAAMGTEVDCLLDAHPSLETATAFWAAEREFRRLEALLSRFLPDSELSRLNAEGELSAGPDLMRVVECALEARERTGGRFDPTVHDALVRAGYDRTFEAVPRSGPATSGASPCAGEVVVDRRARTIRLAPGVRLDLGGIAKGDAVDRACALLRAAGPCLVNAGGDLAVAGTPVGGTWPVSAATASGSITLGLTHGGLATTGRDRRRWRRGDEERHHVIDPVTGRPSSTDLLRVTVAAPSAVEAEIRAKALFLAGSAAAEREANELEEPAVLVTADGRTLVTGGLA